MFHFMKKEKNEEERAEKERRKREKRERKEKMKQEKLSADDLNRLEEVRRSLRVKSSKYEEGTRGLSADFRDSAAPSVVGLSYAASEIAGSLRPTELSSDNCSITSWSKEGSLGRGHERPFKSILKSKKYSLSGSLQSDLDDVMVLLKNTQQNELIVDYKRELAKEMSLGGTSTDRRQSLSSIEIRGESSGSIAHRKQLQSHPQLTAAALPGNLAIASWREEGAGRK